MFNDIYKALKSMQKIEKELGRLFKNYNQNKDKFFGFPDSSYIIPKTKITETETRIRVDIELPGLHMNDVKVKVTQDLLELHTNKTGEPPYNSFYAMIPMPAGIFMKSMKKIYRKGVMSLHFEKYMPKKLTDELEEF